MTKSHVYFLALIGCMIAACGDAGSGASEPKETAAVAAAATGTMPLPSPEAQLADYERALAKPQAEVPEHDADGRPTFYYGRVFVRARSEMAALDLLAFSHDRYPFFDEWEWTKDAPLDTSQYVQGRWEYAIGTGVQWNLLITSSLVSAVELNPRFDKFDGPKQAHPMLEEFVGPTGALIPAKLGEVGFNFKLKAEQMCIAGGQRPAWIGGDAWDWVKDKVSDGAGAVGDAFDGVLDEIADKLRKVGKDISEVLKKGYQGLQEAIDVLRELGNAGVCLLAGSRSHSGHVYYDISKYTNNGSSFPKQMPLRGVKVQARGGPGGVLLTRTDPTDDDGYYYFDDFCGDIDYTVYVLMDAGTGEISDDGYSEYKVDLGEVTENDPSKDWTVTDWSAAWLVGADIGRSWVQKNMGFTPSRPRIFIGWFADKITPGTSATLCGQAALITPIIAGLTGGLGAFAAPLLDGDIYGNSGAKDRNLLGVAVHEYAHHAMCRAIAQHGGDLGKFLNKYMVSVLPGVGETDDDKRKFAPVRNSAEAFADYVAFEAMGYTDYFENSYGSHLCGASGNGYGCLEPDPNWQLPPSDPKEARGWIASRASVMFDWTDGSASSINDDLLFVPGAFIAKGVAKSGSEPTTQTIASWISHQDPGYAEKLCSIFESHGWSCGLDGAGAQLEAPDAFNGVPISESEIRWTWAPTSQLATSYVVVNAKGDVWSDVGSVGADTFSYTESVSGGPNTLVVGAVEARRTGAKPGRSVRREICTLAEAVTNLTATPGSAGVTLAWKSGAATKYVVQRATDDNGKAGSFTPIATIASNTYTDTSAAPAITYQYRVDSVNCSGAEREGAVTKAKLPFDDSAYIYVRTGAKGGDGSHAAPYGTLAEANSALTAARSTILLAQGDYPERMMLPNIAAVRIFGGYDPDFKQRNISAYVSRIIGDNSSWAYQQAPGSEFPFAAYPIFLLEDGSLTLDGLTIDPGQRLCPAGGCYRLTLALVDEIALRNVIYIETSGLIPPVVPNAIRYASIKADTCTVADSDLDVSASPGATLQSMERNVFSCGTITAVGSSMIGASDRRLIVTSDGTIDRMLLLGGASELDPAGSVALGAANCVDVTNSVLTGQTALMQGQAYSGGDCPTHAIADTALYGSIDIYRMQLVNNVAVFESGRQLRIGFGGPMSLCVAPACTGTQPPMLTGITIRNNVVVAEPGSSLDSAYRNYYQKGSLELQQLNDAYTVLGQTANTLKDNQFAADTNGLFADGALQPNAAEPFAPSKDPLVLTRFAGTDLSALGILVTHDLRNDPRSFANLSVGPYQH